MTDNLKMERLKEKAYGHPAIWECTLEEFIEKVAHVLQEHQNKNNFKRKVFETAAGFLRLKFDNKELKGEIEYEVAKAIENSLMYYANVLGEDV